MSTDAEHWAALAELLPAADAEFFLDHWQIGEQEGGIRFLVERLLATGTPLSATARAEIAVLAEAWGVLGDVGPDLRRCLDDPAGDACLRLLEAIPRPAASAPHRRDNPARRARTAAT